MVRKFLALLGLLVSLIGMLFATPAAARVYNAETATCTNQVQAESHLSDAAARRLQDGWSPHKGLPFVTKATPGIWQACKARLDALEVSGVSDSTKRVALATSPRFVFPSSVSPTPSVSTPVVVHAPPALQADTASPALPEIRPIYGTARTIFTPATEMLRGAWYTLLYGGAWKWLAATGATIFFIAGLALAYVPQTLLARAHDMEPDNDKESEPEPLLLTPMAPEEPGGPAPQPTRHRPEDEISFAEGPAKVTDTPAHHPPSAEEAGFRRILAEIQRGPGGQASNGDVRPPSAANKTSGAPERRRPAVPPPGPPSYPHDSTPLTRH